MLSILLEVAASPSETSVELVAQSAYGGCTDHDIQLIVLQLNEKYIV